MKLRPLFAAVASAALATACVASDSDPGTEVAAWNEASAKADDPNADGISPTKVDSVSLLDGYDKLQDAVAGGCVAPAAGPLSYSVGSVAKPFDVYVVSSREDLAKKVGVDLDVKVKYGTVSAGPTLSFVDSFEQTRTSVNLLVAARATYRVSATKSVVLTDNAAALLATDPRAFLHRCGNFYVNGIELEAQLFVLIHFDLKSSDTARTIGADLGVSASTGAVNFDSTLKSSITNTANRADVTVQTHVLDRGFLIDGGTGSLMGSLLEGKITADTFAKIDAVRAAMLTSLQGDVCRDGGGAGLNCSGTNPGYPTNSTRYAVPVRVDLRAYSRAQNAPIGGSGSPYQAMRDLIAPADRYLRALSKSAARLDAIDHDEIQAYLAASPDRRALYGIAAPAAPLYSTDAMVATATNYAAAIDVARSNVSDLAGECWNAIAEGALEVCVPPTGMHADDLAAVKAAAAVVADYGAHGRIVPLAFAAKGVSTYARAHDLCAAAGRRLPTLDEAKRLAVPIAYGTFARSTDSNYAYMAWHSGTGACSDGSPAFANPTPHAACVTGSLFYTPQLTTLCVPSQGPFTGIRPL